MFIFGHMGLGRGLVKKCLGPNTVEPTVFFLLGTLLPDLIDKPIHYFLRTFLSSSWVYADWLRGTRSLGHSLIFLAALGVVLRIRKSEVVRAIFWGTTAHLILDQISDVLGGAGFSNLSVTLWPALGFAFPRSPYGGVEDHFSSVFHWHLLSAEILGILFLTPLIRKSKKLSQTRMNERS